MWSRSTAARMVMGTFARVVVIARSERAAEVCIEAAFDVQERIESLMSYHRPGFRTQPGQPLRCPAGGIR